MKYSLFHRALLSLSLGIASHASANEVHSFQQPFFSIYKELVEINTTNSVGNTTIAVKAMKKRLIAAGFDEADINIIEPFPRKGNLVVRFKGNGSKKPILLLAHLDVVEANAKDWPTDPFKLTEKDGYLIARGAVDDKAMASSFVSILIQLKQQGFMPSRDIILALTADEEIVASKANGAAWLINHHRELIDADFAINEGARGVLKNDKPFTHIIQLADKTYVDYLLTVTGPGGHSARPTQANTVYDLSEAVIRLRQNTFPVMLNDLAKAYFEKSALVSEGQLADDMRSLASLSPSESAIERMSRIPYIVGLLRSTCVATMLKAGHAPNALSQQSEATVNCRILPDDDPNLIEAQLKKVVGNKVTVKTIKRSPSSPRSPLREDVITSIEKISEQLWPGTPVIPTQGVSTTDGGLFRKAGIPVYGASGMFVDPSNVGTHGVNEKIKKRDLFRGREFLYRLVIDLAK